ncbi:MAG: hypothetical protein AMXMBFR60_15000 [Chloroflexota bacterium]
MSLENNLFYKFEWDENKARINLAKHKISFDEGRTIFADPFLITIADDEHSHNEDRFVSMGKSTNERILLVVHLERYIKKQTMS